MVNFLLTLKFVVFAEIVERYALVVLMAYVTDVWGLGLTHAAGLINVWTGITKAMPMMFLFLIDNCTGSYWMCLISTTASALGMGVLAISTPSWLYSRITGSCSEYKLECISETQQWLFYIALILTMVGKSAREATMDTLKFKGSDDEIKFDKGLLTWGNKVVIWIAGALIPMIKPWSIRFGISTVFSLVVICMLIGNFRSHKQYIDQPERSPFSTMLRVFVASIWKPQQIPDESTGFYQEIEEDGSPLCSSSTNSSLENSAILPPINNESNGRWRLYGRQEVEDTKTLVRMLPAFLLFIFIGLISSIGNTYFIEQAKDLNPNFIFGYKISVSFLIMIHDSSKDGVDPTLKKEYEDQKMFGFSLAGIAAVVYAVLCFLIAAPVEKLRLKRLADEVGDIIPMSMFWLLPQIYFLGCVEGMLESSIKKLFIDKMPSSMKNFANFFSKGIMGVGIVTSVLLQYVVSKVSAKGGGLSWFQHDIDNSRLDLFYWVLTALCGLVLTIWVTVSCFGETEIDVERHTPSISDR